MLAAASGTPGSFARRFQFDLGPYPHGISLAAHGLHSIARPDEADDGEQVGDEAVIGATAEALTADQAVGWFQVGRISRLPAGERSHGLAHPDLAR
jgi:hypothetical protein